MSEIHQDADVLLYTVPAACRALSCGRTKLFDLLKQGRLKAKRDGALRVIPRAEIEAYIASLPDAA